MTDSEIIEGLKAIRTIHNGNYAPYVDEAIKRLSAEPYGDCISRSELLKVLDTWDKFGYRGAKFEKLDRIMKKYFVPYIHYDDVVKAIKGMSSIQSKARWIPVTEDLPKTSDDVLVWFEYIKDDYDCAWWGLGYYSLRYKKWVVSTNEHNPIVKAWAPLLEPFEAESEEKKC